MTCSPVVLFVYNRIDHTHRTVIALSSNVLANKTDLIIFSDAARSLDKQASVDEVRAYLKAITGFRSVTIHHRQHNFGLAKSIITGVTQVFAVHERIIVLEDDMVTSPYFLTYMMRWRSMRTMIALSAFMVMCTQLSNLYPRHFSCPVPTAGVGRRGAAAGLASTAMGSFC